jgi:histidinol phosphatase-like enzyme (inositol monophosphatase family)
VTISDLALAEMLAEAAGQAIRPWFRRPFLVETKEDFSPVTAADKEAEAAIRRLLAQYRPDDGVIGEEYGDDRPDAERVWVLDPIDGTRAFVAGRPLFGTLSGLMEQGTPVLGIIDQCIIRDRWMAAPGQHTTLNGARVHVRHCTDLAQARIGTTSPQAFGSEDFTCFERVRTAARDTLYGGDCHNYGLVAAGHLDAVVESGLKLHDWAALVPIITGAGGVITDWEGQPLTTASRGAVIAAGDPALAAAIAEALSCPD